MDIDGKTTSIMNSPSFMQVVTFYPDELVDWLNTIERVFEYYYVSKETKVKLVSKYFKGRALAWWKHCKLVDKSKIMGRLEI